jgi:hypothetical protein
MGREPTLEGLRGQVNQVIRETILERAAVAMGLDKDDVVVRRRLARKTEFLFKDLSGLAAPSDEELRKHLDRNRSRYEIPVRVTFVQVFFNTEKRGEEGAERAVKTFLESAAVGDGNPSAAHQLGDASMLPTRCEKCDALETQGRCHPVRGTARSCRGTGFTRFTLKIVQKPDFQPLTRSGNSSNQTGSQRSSVRIRRRPTRNFVCSIAFFWKACPTTSMRPGREPRNEVSLTPRC